MTVTTDKARAGTFADPRDLRAAWSVAAVFLLNGLTFAVWSSRIPTIKQTLGLTAGELGLILFIGSIGSLISLPTAGRVVMRIGASRTVWAGVAGAISGLVLLGVAVGVYQSPILVAVALFALGFGNGLWDVAMNLEGAAVEHSSGRVIMPRFHAAFSGGTVLSALVTALLLRMDVGIVPQTLVAAVLIPILMVFALRGFLPRTAEEGAGETAVDEAATSSERGRSGSAWLEPRTLLIGVVVLVAALTEGTANDWVSVAFVEGHHLPAWAGVLAFATFLTAMTIGRLVGPAILERHGRVATLRVLFVLAGIGSLLVVFGSPAVAYAGAVLWGLGASLGFPVGMSAAADEPARAAARMSVVSTIGYTAFLTGPTVLGFLGDHVGVLHSLLLVGGLALVALALVPATREPARRTEVAPEGV